MNLSPMRFKTFVWPHNPRVYAVACRREMAVNKIPLGGYALQSLGQTRRIFRGEGEFVGEDAYRSYRELEALFREDTPGMLVHPVWTAAQVWAVSLELEQEPRSDYVRYSFEFWECGEAVSTGLTLRPTEDGVQEEIRHRVQAGDTLWAIAAAYGTTVEAVLALNPDIRNPNLIYAGQEVRVA